MRAVTLSAIIGGILRLSKKVTWIVFMVSSVVLMVSMPLASAQSFSNNDLNSILGQTPFYDPNAVDCSGNSATGSTATPSVTPSSVNNVYILGDSITERSQSQYQEALQQKGITTNIDASSSRSLDGAGRTPGNTLTGMEAIAKDKATLIHSAQAIVIALGTNGGDTPASVDAAIQAIRTGPDANTTAPIYWVDTISVGRNDGYNQTVIKPNNQAIYSESTTKVYQVISWFKTVDSSGDPQNPNGAEVDPNKYIDNSDGLGVHPTPAGITALVNLVVGAVTGGSATTGSGAGPSCACSIGSTTLTGSDNEQQAFNFFVQQGLSAVQAAAVVGNLMNESHMSPTLMEKGGNSQNPADADPLGWGIVQWTPGSRITGIAQDLHITTLIYELATQLNITWAEMNGTAPTGYQNVAAGLKQISDLTAAVTFFQVHFESGIPGNRQQFAADALQKYGGSVPTTNPTSGGGCGSSGLSPDCQAATGVAKIICDAKKYDPVSYSETTAGGHQGGAAWHASCPTIGPSCILDCSGLVNIALYDVYGVDLRQVTGTEVSDSQNWQHISLSQIQPGDLVQPNSGHVEIIDHIQGITIYTFGAHTAKVPQPDQVGPAFMPVTSGNVYLHYIGQGSTS